MLFTDYVNQVYYHYVIAIYCRGCVTVYISGIPIVTEIKNVIYLK